ncbi:tail fiber assembly protein [Bombella saccharophila]|uniref:Tail fiber assembly protein n=1 Tax=Bombella saccharophila TaxID=2967338 RepID=A0ABT3W9R5_9PROT|nr:tail fiber assembly protein [Bombella saccharophila]MCX5615363.1 hypothetical protein [Bombella saccharophila]PHI93985.1 hypothetical protein BG621_08410 [Parasaccharibacter apium]
MINFNKNGFALENGTMTVYGFDAQTGVYTGSYTAQIIVGCGAPGNSTPLAPPPLQTGQAATFDGSAWSVVEDHRDATVWNKADGSPTTVVTVGPLPNTVTTVQPTGSFVTWDDKTNTWVFNQSLRDKQLKAQATSALQAARQIVYNNYGIIGEPTPDNWVAYIKALMAIVNGTDTTSKTLPTAPSEPTA